MPVSSSIVRKIRNFYTRVRWFKNNYFQIKHSSVIGEEAPPILFPHFHGPVTYNTDSLITSNNADFIKESRFAKAYSTAVATNPWPGFTLQWRVYIVCWFADYVKHLSGDFVECGVNTGAYSRAVIDYINFNSLNKVFYLFDTYEGLVEDLVSDEEKKAGIAYYLGNHYPNVYEQVVETFKPFNTKIIQGIVPDTLVEFQGNNISFLSIDMNCVAPEIAAAEFFWSKLVSGAVIILDDYGFPQHILQKLAFDKFAKEKGVEILTLPTGQGILFKP